MADPSSVPCRISRRQRAGAERQIVVGCIEFDCTWIVTIIVSQALASHVSSAPWSDYCMLVARLLTFVLAVHAEMFVCFTLSVHDR